MEKASWTVYWNEYSSDTYLYGSEIEYVARNNVRFKNELMPPGTVIKQWYSLTNYQAQRIEPALPIIDGESRYRIKVNVETPEDTGCLVRLVFLDRYEREAGDFTLRGKEAEFSCPLKTYSYRMQLINAGMTEFVFHSVIIEELESKD
ncbi:accessory Sec system protein Asp3 [Pseudobutyrivibrio xylanivorans]|jgi:accessory Sec system protein Asp3|uniref:Accessory secretory protein Asp3 n=1 Tax=Pseudobutyrivibrio xylanivorans DSM 14809 TaxID=1123012 RepID=A0A1M6HHF6_PSEXY|nr:accessory Sec system protein Asp3 [Pseudobutyrivibrio xylanivorans]SHJ21601.1 accessory secretory protein Asp3 [Pseudobutyrivibrio xylanivorans DSM 14809]